MRFLLDTDHISIIELRTEPEFTAITAHSSRYPKSDLVYSIVSFHEQIMGCNTYISRARGSGVVRGYAMLGDTLRYFAMAKVLPFNASAATVFDQLRSQRVRIATMDLRIASIALSNGLVLLTRNVSDFGRVPGLVTEDWTV